MENLTLPAQQDSDRLSQGTDTTDSMSPMYPSLPRRGTHPVFFPDQMDLSALFTTTPTEAFETKVLRLCNKQFVSRMSWTGDATRDTECDENEDDFLSKGSKDVLDYDYDIADIWQKLGHIMTRDVMEHSITEESAGDEDDNDADSNQYQSRWLRSLSRSISHHVDSRTLSRERMRAADQATSYGGKLYRTDGHYGRVYGLGTRPRSRCDVVEEHVITGNEENNDPVLSERDSKEQPRVELTDDEIKQAVVKLREDLIKLRSSDRKLLKQFIQIRFGIEYQDWSRRKNQGSVLDLSAQCTLPRNPTSPTAGTTHALFRKRALSLAGNTPGYSTFAGRGTTIKEVP